MLEHASCKMRDHQVMMTRRATLYRLKAQCVPCRTAATNVFEKQNGRWVMVHHHGSPVPMFV